MSLFSKAESFLKASGYDVSKHPSEPDFLIAEKPDLGESSITCVGVAEGTPEYSAQHLIVERFERVARVYPTATLKFLYSPSVTIGAPHLTDIIIDDLRNLKVSTLSPAFFFDTLFTYDSNRSAASIVKDLAENGRKQERLRVKQPYRLASGEQGEDLAEYLLEEATNKKVGSSSPTLWIVSAPAGYGKSYMFASLFHQMYAAFQNAKRSQTVFPRPLPMIAEHLRSSAGPNIKGLIDTFLNTDFAGHTPPELFTWMVDNGHGFWMTDGLDEVLSGDDDFFYFLWDRLTRPSSYESSYSYPPLILMSLRDSLLQSREELQELIETGDDVVHLIELLPWGVEQKHSFAWTKVYKKPPPQKKHRSNARLRNLVNALTKDENINRLSSTPFYADILANEFLEEAPLASMNEFDLLDHAVGAMCEREYDKKGPIERTVLPIEDFRDWLEEVAGDVVTQSGISIDELREFASLVLVLTKGGISEPEKESLVKQIMVMPFLKNSPVSGRFEFIHEILGEFLAGSFYAKKMQASAPAGTLALDWVSRGLGQQALRSDSMLLKVIAWHFQEKRDELVEAVNECPSIAPSGNVHRNVVQLLALMKNGRELLDNIRLSLAGADLSEVQFGSMDLKEMSFMGSDLSFTDLSECNLQNAIFEGTRLHNTSLPSQKSQCLRGTIFKSMKGFESIHPQGEHRIDSYDRFVEWTEVATQVEIEQDLPCPSARQLTHLLGKFVRPNGAPRRDWIDERGLIRGKQIEGGPGYQNTVDKVLEFRYLEETSPRRVSRPRGPLYGEIVQFMKTSTLSPGLNNLLASLCRRPGCSHVDPIE